MRGWWVGAVLLGASWAAYARENAPVASASSAAGVATDDAPFTLLEGVEVGRSEPLRDLPWTVFGYTLDGGRLLAADADGAALIDDRGAVRTRLDCPAAAGVAPTDLALSGDNAVAIARYPSGVVCAWSGDGTPLSTPAKDGTAAAAGGDRIVAVGFADGRVEGRDPRTGRKKWTRNAELGGVVHMRWEADGPRVAASSGLGGVAVLDARSGRLVRALRGRAAFSAAFDRTGALLAVGRDGGRVEIWDTTQWYRKASFQLTVGDVVDVDFAPQGEMLAAAVLRTRGGVRETVLEVWDFALEEPIFREIAPAGEGPARVRFDAVGDRLVAGNGASAGRMWPRPGTRGIPRPAPNDEPPRHRPIKEQPVLPALALVEPVARLPGARLATNDGARVLVHVEASSADTGRSPDASPSWGGGARPPATPPGGSAVADPAVPPAPPLGLAVAEVATGAFVPLAGSDGAVGPFALSPDGARVAAWSGERLLVWDGATGALLGRVGVGKPRAVALLGARLAVATEDGRVYAGTLERVRVVPDAAGVTAVALDPFHADRVALGTEEGGVRIVEARTGARIGAWAVHAGAPTALVFSTDGRLLATAGPRPGVPGGKLVVLGTERREEDAEPWTAVLDALPDRLAFDASADLVVARAAGSAAVVRRGGVALELSANLVDAALAPDGLRWVDPLGNVRVAAVGEAGAAVPRGRLFARSDDFRFSVTVDGDRLAVWDDKKGLLLRALPSTGQAVAACGFDDAGERLVVRYADGTVEVYEVASGEALRNVPSAPEGAETWLRFSDDGALVWAFSAPDEVTGWEVATGEARERVRLPGPARVDAATARLRFVRFTTPAGEAYVDTTSASPRRLTVAADGFRPVAVVPGGRELVGAVEGGLARLDARAGRRVGPVMAAPGDAPAGPAAVSADGAWLAAAYARGQVRVWDLGAGRVAAVLGTDARGPFAPPVRPVASVAFDPAGEVVTTRDASGFPRIFEWRLAIEAPVVGLGAGPVLPAAGIAALAVAPDGRTLYSAHRDGNARAWDLLTGAQTLFFWGHAGPLTTLAARADRIVTGSEDGTVRAWDSVIANQRLALSTFGDPVRSLAVSGDGLLYAAAGDGAVVRAWDAAKGKGLRRWALPAVADGLAAGPVRGAIAVALGEASWLADPTTGAVRAGALGPLPGSGVEMADLAALRTMAAMLAPITAEVATPDGRTYVTAGADGRIRLWDRETMALRATLRALTDGSWILDRADGSRYASESLRDGSSPLLYRPPPYK